MNQSRGQALVALQFGFDATGSVPLREALGDFAAVPLAPSKLEGEQPRKRVLGVRAFVRLGVCTQVIESRTVAGWGSQGVPQALLGACGRAADPYFERRTGVGGNEGGGQRAELHVVRDLGDCFHVSKWGLTQRGECQAIGGAEAVFGLNTGDRLSYARGIAGLEREREQCTPRQSATGAACDLTQRRDRPRTRLRVCGQQL